MRTIQYLFTDSWHKAKGDMVYYPDSEVIE